MISNKAVLQFKTDLWKDQRALEVRDGDTSNATFIKHYDNEEEAICEQEVIRHLAKYVGDDSVPELLEYGPTTSTLRYIFGIRIFNLLVELDNASGSLNDEAGRLKRLIIKRCEARQRKIQNALYTLPNVKSKSPYPLRKVGSIIEILGECLDIKWDKNGINLELEWLEQSWAKSAIVPFRDATCKNMVLASRDLWLGSFVSEDQRRDFIYESIKSGTYQRWLEAPIIDYDFCSCLHNTTPEDDVISIRFHERTWLAPPASAADVVWDFEPNSERAAITFFVRFYRFGGRKAAYRLLHSTGHRIRFRHDSDAFYFDRLPEIMRSLWPEVSNQLPGLLEFTEVLRRHLPLARTDVDYFMAIHPLEKRNYYVDVYPR